MPRRLIILRHGESTHNAEARWQGQTDPPLSEVGRAQARAAAQALAAMHPVRVVASDLVRAAETGRAVADAAGVALELEPAFREIDVGSWAGRTHDEVRRAHSHVLERIAAGEDLPRGGAETVADVRARVRPTLQQHLDAVQPGGCVVVAAHGMSGWVMAVDLIGEDTAAPNPARGHLCNAHWIDLEDDGSGWRVRAWNVGAEPGSR